MIFLSPILYSVDNLIRISSVNKIRCIYNEYMEIFTYADDISFLWPTLSGIQKNVRYVKSMPLIIKLPLMLLSQLLYLGYLDKDHSDSLNLTMTEGNVTPSKLCE